MISVAINSNKVKANNLMNVASFSLPIVFAIAIASIFSFYNITENILVFYFGIIILFGFSILLKPQDFLLIFVFLVPNVYIIKQINVPTAFIGYAFLISVVKYLFQSKKKNIPLSLIVHALIVLIPVTGYLDISLLTSLIRFSAATFFLFAFCESDFYKNDDYKKLLIKSFMLLNSTT